MVPQDTRSYPAVERLRREPARAPCLSLVNTRQKIAPLSLVLFDPPRKLQNGLGRKDLSDDGKEEGWLGAPRGGAEP
jgi:hypothetical protein